MKKVFIAFLFILPIALTSLYSQTEETLPKSRRGFHIHKGLHASISGGPVFGPIKEEYVQHYYKDTTKATYSGFTFMFDFNLGYAIVENVILNATILSSTTFGPTIEYSGGTNTVEHAPLESTLGEIMLGVGLTYYITPHNFFLSASYGRGAYSVNSYGNSARTIFGPSYQFKIGKEWWVSRNWSIGAAFSLTGTNIENTEEENITSKMTSNRFALMFTSSFN